jgi:AraC-like DNA-binding protein
LKSTLPLHHYPLVRTRSLEEAAHIQSGVSGPVTVEQIDRRTAFRWEANRTLFGRLGIMATGYGASIHARSQGVSQHFSLVVPIHRRASAKQARKTADLVPGRTAVLCSPSMPTEFLLESGYHGRTIGIPTQVVESTLDALTGISRAESVRFDLSVNLGSAGGAAALRLFEFMVSEVDRRGPKRSPIVEDQLAEAFVCALLSGLPHNHSRLFTTTPMVVEPLCVRRAEEYIEANAHEHIALADLAAVTGVAIRTLTAAFRTHRGYSPMAFLRTRRFELAHKRLVATSAATVAAVALSCGFEHLGRFSVGYRARFGESPTETLRRSRAQKETSTGTDDDAVVPLPS